MESVTAYGDSPTDSTFANATLLSMLMNWINLQKYKPVTSKTFKNEYDFIIVGAGSAGSTVAARLSEVKDVDVLLLEAGSDPPAVTEVPFMQLGLLKSNIDWNFRTVPQEHTGDGLKNRSVYIAAGKVLGGTSTMNIMLYVRGNQKNYDDWAAAGATGWSYEDVLPYFKKFENNRNPEFVNNFGGEGYHGFDGPMTVMIPPYKPKLKQAALDAAAELGYPVVDANGQQQKGFYPPQTNIRDGRRCGTAKAYLAEVDNRENLDIVKDALVTKVITEDRRAVGVEFFCPGDSTEKRTVGAGREVIVSAGTMNTAKLLKLSGIGPKEELEKHKIPVVADLPVGFNFHDHASSFLGYHLAAPSALEKSVLQLPEYLANSSGILSCPEAISMIAFLSKDDNATADSLPDYEIYFAEGAIEVISQFLNIKDEIFEKVYVPHAEQSIMFCVSQLVNPRSRGTVTLSSADPRDPPLIDPNYFDDPSDLDDLLQGMKKCNQIADTEAMKKIGVERWTTKMPGCEEFEMDSDDYLRCQIKTVTGSLWHLAGTAKMGSVNDPTTVVDPQLRVKGVDGLRVVDASVMPRVTSGNPNSPVIMIAEKAADMIKASIKGFEK